MTKKEVYRKFCERENALPLFVQDWWLDAVCGKNSWDVALVDKGGEIVASMPYFLKTQMGFRRICMPPFTQRMGPWIKYPDEQKYAARLSYEKEIINELIDQLPSFDDFVQNFHHGITNWLPFYWRGFQQTTAYSYVINNISNLQSVFSNFEHAKRKNINKASKLVDVKFDLTPDVFYENHKYTLRKQNLKILYTYELFDRIYKVGYANKKAKTIYAIDKEGNLHSALFVVWDNTSAYDLISTIDPDFRNSGSASLLVYEMIKYVSNFINKFDFEGSMIEDVENSFRQFGGIQIQLFQISRTPSKLLKIARFAKEFLK